VSRRALQLLFVLTGALLAFTGGGAPAGAIETQSFGLDVAERTEDGRLHLELRAGETTTGRVKVWNKTEAPLTLSLRVVPAELGADGRVSLGGDGAGVDWVSLEPDEVRLDGGQERTVEVRASAPRKIDDEVQVVAIQVEPATVAGEAPPAVLQRLALTTYLEPDKDSLIASLGPFPWIALAILLVVATALVRSAIRRRRVASAPPIG
jgi:hypothetical protein